MKAMVLLSCLLCGCVPSEPKTYEDCLLRHLGSTTNGEAAKLVHRACIGKYPRAAATSKTR